MPPKIKRPKPFPWAKRHGKLEPFAEGVLFGLSHAGYSAADVAALLNMTRQSVYDVRGDLSRRLGADLGSLERAQLEDTDDEVDQVEKKPYQSYHEAVENRRAEIARLTKEKDEGGNDVYNSSREIARVLRGIVTPRTVRRDLNFLGLSWKSRPKTAFMTEEHMTKRVALGRELRCYNPEDIIFTDECQFDCRDMQLKVWQRPGEPVLPRRVERWTARVSVWGAIAHNFRLLVILPADRVNAESYQQTLRNELLPIFPEGKFFMQDGAPAHSAKSTKSFLEESGVELIPWPAKSPDLNPIETLWGIMKQRIKVETKADVDELESAIIDVWNSIDQNEINELVMDFPNRVEKMLQRKGDDSTIKRCYL